MKKRILSILLCLLLVSPFASCTRTGSQTPDSQESSSAGQTQSDVSDSEESREIIEGREVVTKEEVNSFDPEYIRLFGRTLVQSGKLLLGNVGTGAELCFYGTSLSAYFTSANITLYCSVFIDEDTEGTFTPILRNGVITLAEGLEEGVHTVRILKASSSQNGDLQLSDLSTDGKFLAPEEPGLRIEFVGDSITAGAGVYAQSDEACSVANSDGTKSYAYRTAQALDADFSLVAIEGICVQGKGPLRINMLEMYTQYSSIRPAAYPFPYSHDIVVVALGTNDSWYLSSNPQTYSQQQFTADYLALLSLIRSHNPDAYIVCIYGMMGSDQRITDGIQEAIGQSEDSKISFCPPPAGTDGGEAHPSAQNALTQASVLTDYLKSLID